MKKFHYMDPEMIMTVVVSLIILVVGVYSFFVVIDQTQTEWAGIEGVSEPAGLQSSEDNATWYEIKMQQVTSVTQVIQYLTSLV